jgi:GNAT superfamily N-acetyltransferase
MQGKQRSESTIYMAFILVTLSALKLFLILRNILSMKVSLRVIVPEDAAAVAILSAQLGYTISEEQTLKNIKAIIENENCEAFVALYEDDVVGWTSISYNIQLESPPSAELRGLVIDERYRKKGIGKMLIEKAKEWGREKGLSLLRLRCNVKRIETHLFYSYLGFVETKQQKVFEITL